MDLKYNLLVVFGLAVLINVTDALYFHIGETERKCFIEEIPDETNVIGNSANILFYLES